MNAIRTAASRALPRAMRDCLRYLTNEGYRTAVREARVRDRHRADVRRLVTESGGALWSSVGGMVASGPFCGLRYVREAFASSWAPKILGTYERELETVMLEIIEQAPKRIVDIGSAEGYYAVGLAWRIPTVHVIAFEAQDPAHRLLRELATANGVDARIDIRGTCLPATLRDALRGAHAPTVICDAEGAELELLDPVSVPELLAANVLVELHPWAHCGLKEMIRDRFTTTHEIEEIRTRIRKPEELPAGLPVSQESAMALMDEMRPGPMTWLWLRARQPRVRPAAPARVTG